jgi:hypothetical protein
MEEGVNTRIAKRVQVPHSAVYDMRKKLISEGTNARKVFGGVEGLATYVRRAHLM